MNAGDLYELIEEPPTESPVLVLAVDGWIDAGLGAANARAALVGSLPTRLVARFDADALLDHRARRPTMHLVEGVLHQLSWPSIELHATTDTNGNGVLVLLGAEPDHRWHAFCRAVIDLAVEFGTRMIVGLGAYPAPVPHTRPTRLAVAASDPDLASAGSVHTTVDVPGGVQAAIERRGFDVGLPAVGLWAQVPHYVSAMPYPAASAILLDTLGSTAGLALDSSALHKEAAATRQRLDALVQDNEEHLAMVHQLERYYDEEESAGQDRLTAGTLPSGDDLVAELERFLRDQGG